LCGRELYSTVKSGVKAGLANPRTVPSSDGSRRSAGPLIEECHYRPNASISRQPMKIWRTNDEGPPESADEERRHVYKQDRVPIKIKVKRRSGGYVNWYRVTGEQGDGWQAAKPLGYEACPYTGAFDAFDPEFRNEVLYWPEGEKDCDTLSGLGW